MKEEKNEKAHFAKDNLIAFKFYPLTVSTRAFDGVYEDLSGKKMKELAEQPYGGKY